MRRAGARGRARDTDLEALRPLREPRAHTAVRLPSRSIAMNGPLLSRRAFIRSGAIALAVPTLEAMFSKKALAAGTSDPKRYVCIYIASGTYIKLNDGAFWYPGTTPAALDAANLPAVFQPFSAN